MGDQRRGRVGALSVALALGLVLTGLAHAEDVAKRAKLPSNTIRARGVVGMMNTPVGLLALGGPRLRRLPPGARDWKVILEVKGDSLYRLAENRGRVLAAYEKEPIFHLIDIGSSAHRTFPKPQRPTGIEGFQDWRLDGIDFTEDGREALVHMWAAAYTARTGSYTVHAAYRVPLEGNAPPVELYREEGFRLDLSSRGAVLLKPKSWALGCSHSGCPVDRILAFEFEGARANRRVLFDGKDARYDSAQIVPSSRKHAIAVQITGWDEKVKKPMRGLLRYTYGEQPLYHRPSETPAATFDLSLLARNNDYLEGRQGEDKSVTITRLAPDGSETRTHIKSWGDARGRPARAWLTSIRERKNGDLWLHWGDDLVIVNERGPRRVDVGGHVVRGTEWAGAYLYVEEPEAVWLGIEMGAGRDYIRIDFADLERQAKPWAPATLSSDDRGLMPPAVATRLQGQRTERKLGRGVLSVGATDLYYRDDTKEPWRLLHALPERSIYRMQIDEAGGRIVAHWSSEREIHLFEPGADVHKIYPWPASDVEGFNAGLQHLFFDPDGAGALVFMSGLVRGRGSESLNEFYRVPFDGGTPTRLYRLEGHRLHVSEGGATFIKPTKNQGHCNVRQCVLDSVYVVALANGRATTRDVFRTPSYTDHASLVPGSVPGALGVMVQHSDPVNARNPARQRVLLRFAYDNPAVTRMALPEYTLEAVKRNHLTGSGDYIEFIAMDDAKRLRMEIHRGQDLQIWELPVGRRGLDAGADDNVHGFGERDDGSFWLHWGDRILLLARGKPARALDIGNKIKRGEWAGADRYRNRPEVLTIGIDIGAGRTFIDLPFSIIDRSAKTIGLAAGQL